MSGVRPTTGDAYREGRGAVLAAEVRVLAGAEIGGHERVRADVCVIGTGAGGAVVAKELAEGGLNVVMVEAGEHVTTDDLNARPREMYRRLYRDAGQFTTIGNVPIMLPHGRAVGGTTLINSGTCFRTPPVVLDSWAGEYGLEIDAAAMEPYFRRVEREINVAQVPPEIAGRNTEIVHRASKALGWSGDYLFRNARGCVGSGTCAFGCPTSAKQHTGLTYVTRAWNAGAVTFTGCTVDRIVVEGGRARGVEARTTGGGRLSVEAGIVVLAAGTIDTPPLLQGSGLGGGSGQLGRNLTIHPASAVIALMDEVVELARGVPQSYYIDEFAGEGVMLEGAAGPPDHLSAVVPFSGSRHRDLMLRYQNFSQFGIMISDHSRGRVVHRGGKTIIHYDLQREDVTAFKRGMQALFELYVEAGALRIFLPVASHPEVAVDDPGAVERIDVRASDLKLMAFHPLGTARAHAKPGSGVVDGDLRLHGTKGLYVADGSVVPTALGVNPQETIMALATKLAYYLLDKPAPVDEPEPERIATPKTKELI